MKLLIIEDEPHLFKSISEVLLLEKFICEWARNQREIRRRIDDNLFDCILIDSEMPGGTDLQLLKYLRAKGNDTLVIIVSARNSPEDRTNALHAGADEYFIKPLHLPELAATLKALLRRRFANGNPIWEIGVLQIDLVANKVWVGGKPVNLNVPQFALLFLLAKNRNRFVSKKVIADYLHNGSPEQLPGAGFVYRHIKYLKRKLKDKGYPEIIKTSYRLGYSLI